MFGASARVLDLDGVATHISTLHVVNLISELWGEVILGEYIKAGNGHVVFHHIVWLHLNPEALNIVFNLNVFLERPETVRDEKLLPSEAVMREISIRLLSDSCRVRCSERAVVVD